MCWIRGEGRGWLTTTKGIICWRGLEAFSLEKQQQKQKQKKININNISKSACDKNNYIKWYVFYSLQVS